MLAKECGAVVLRNEKNRGYDESLEMGFQEACQLGADVIVTCDADGQHRPEDLIRVLEPILQGSADVVAALRSRRPDFGERLFAFYTKNFFGVSDPLCGLKAYTREAYMTCGPFSYLHSIGTIVLLRAIRSGKRVSFVQITLNDRKDASRFYVRRLRGNVKVLAAFTRVFLRFLLYSEGSARQNKAVSLE